MKVLFIYPNTPLLNPPPVSIASMTAVLRAQGVEVEVFDTTFHQASSSSDGAKEENLQVRPFSFEGYGLPLTENDPAEDLREHIKRFSPDLVAVSCLEATWSLAAQLLDATADLLTMPVLVGGVFPTFAPELVLTHKNVSMVCIGEGEEVIAELCQCLMQGKDYRHIRNLAFLDGQNVRINPLRPVVDINALPIPDYSVFHPGRFLRPMAGNVYRTVPIETNRGCPYKCAFCNSPSMVNLYRDAQAGRFFRKKTLDRIQQELQVLFSTWKAQYCYFLSDTFLALTDAEFDRFIEIYSEFKLPFWIQSRAETITLYRAKKLKEVGCHRMSIGLEHGNPEFRRKALNKNFNNGQMIRAAQYLAEAGIPLSVNNIIGFPGETRQLVFDTIELNRQMVFDTSNAYAYAPFRGTPLYQECIDKKYIDEKHIVGCLTMDTPLDMPQLPASEIEGLRRTFSMYAKMPKEYWPRIERAEVDDEEGRRIFQELREEFIRLYF